MPDFKPGRLAFSRAGHDKDTVYIVVREEDPYLFLSDGRLKPLDGPKKKKKMHLQIGPETALCDLFAAGETVRDEDIRRVIKAEKSRMAGQRTRDDIDYQED